MAVKKEIWVRQQTIFDRKVKIEQQRSGSFMIVVFDERSAPMGDVYCFSNISDMMTFLSKQVAAFEVVE